MGTVGGSTAALSRRLGIDPVEGSTSAPRTLPSAGASASPGLSAWARLQPPAGARRASAFEDTLLPRLRRSASRRIPRFPSAALNGSSPGWSWPAPGFPTRPEMLPASRHGSRCLGAGAAPLPAQPYRLLSELGRVLRQRTPRAPSVPRFGNHAEEEPEASTGTREIQDEQEQSDRLLAVHADFRSDVFWRSTCRP